MENQRLFYVHIFMETCLPHNVPDHAVTLDMWNRVSRRQSTGHHQAEERILFLQ